MRDGISTVNAQPVTVSGVTAVLSALAIISPCVFVGFLSPAVAKAMLIVAVLGTSVWVAVDAWRLKVREYKSQLAAHPFVLFTASLGLWIVVFPVYLVVRSKIRAGQLPKAPNPRERRVLYACIATWCIVAAMVVAAHFIAQRLARIQ